MKKDKKYELVAHESVPGTFRGLVFMMIRPFRGRVLAFFGLSLLGILSWTVAPYIIRNLINALSEKGEVTPHAWLLVGLFVLARFSDEFFWRVAEYLVKAFKPKMVESVRTALFEETMRKPHSFYVNSSSGRIGHWINQTTGTMDIFVNTTIWSVWPRAIGLILAGVFLLFAHWMLALLFFVWLIALFAFTVKRGKTFSEYVQQKSDAESKTAGRVVDSMSNNVSVRVFNAQHAEIEGLKRQQHSILKYWHKEWGYHYITNMVKGNSVVVVTGAAMSIILYLFSKGEVTVGDIVLFIAYFNDASSSLWELSWQLDQYYNQAGTVNNALSGLLRDENERHLISSETVEKKATSAEIEIKNLSFSYEEQKQEIVLSDISLAIESGAKVGVVGHSGAGKSTLVGLLLGFYEPSKGVIYVNGQDMASNSPAYIRSLIGYVPQDTSLFNRTIRENIAYAKPSAKEEEIIAALKKAEAWNFVEKLPKGLDTLVGERGVKLSGGQRQRIAIARAILKDAPLLLLDEATSALDSVSEQAIQRALHELMKGRTAIVIAHRLSTLKHLDKIFVLEKGIIAEQGTHDELLKIKNGMYADLWKRQKDGFIVE
jgi:ATP-binding cassette subfamily B protein